MVTEVDKQNVCLPKAFRLLFKGPRTNMKIDLEFELHLTNLWVLYHGSDTIEHWFEETNSRRVVFRSYLALKAQAERKFLALMRLFNERLRKERAEETEKTG